MNEEIPPILQYWIGSAEDGFRPMLKDMEGDPTRKVLTLMLYAKHHHVFVDWMISKGDMAEAMDHLNTGMRLILERIDAMGKDAFN